MRALVYRKSVVRWMLLKGLAPRFRRLYTSGLAPVSLRDIPEPKLPTPQWVRIAPRLAGICGSDLSTICAKGSPYFAPLTSMPFVLGHELVGTLVELGRDVKGMSIGDRVVVHPALGCVARGIVPVCEACAQHRDALCRNVTRGDVSAGIQIGFCRDTGGGFGESLVAHQSQIFHVPSELSDRAAVLVEPFACAVHGALRVRPAPTETVLVIGCGAIGLLTVAALRASGCRARIVAAAKYDHQRRLAMALGADALLDSPSQLKERYRRWAPALDAEVFSPELGKPTVIGGASVTFDCVASSQSIDDGIRFTRSGGSLVLVGMPGIPAGVDWTPLWFKELTILAAYAYGPEPVGAGGVDSFNLAMKWMGEWGPRLEALAGTPFELRDHRAAVDSALNTGRSGVAKTLFAIHS